MSTFLIDLGSELFLQANRFVQKILFNYKLSSSMYLLSLYYDDGHPLEIQTVIFKMLMVG